ncbi:MobA/MobL family protein [Sphingomonas floccifaciens]|uniref:MobA/MobL family protein n=1 Tax=Sphingomonas floccifaciens TaxID=1844115 RepID=A0ABW4NJV2_9SPHN
MQLTDRLFHATAAIRAMISRQALEELAGAKPGRRVKADTPSDRRRGGAGWSRRDIDLSFPAPPPWRPSTSDGATSFHFAYSSISKVRPAQGKAPNGALAFERYVTAAEPAGRGRAAVNERYIVDADESALGHSRTAFVVSNISPNPVERERFWTAVNAAASTPSAPALEVRPACGEPSELVRLANEDTTPLLVREALRKAVEAPQAGDRKLARDVHRIELDEDGQLWAEALDIDRYGARKRDRLVHYVRPRGGVLQWQIEADFPEELSDLDNRAIADAFGALLDKLGFKYTIAAHDPTYRNDHRNRHPHILVFPGSCRQRYDGQWEFRGGKLQAGDLAVRLGEKTKVELPRLGFKQRSAADVAALRQAYAEIVNHRLIARGVRRRYDPRTYEAMGIDQEPGEHLGSAAAALVDAGFAVDIDRRNAIKAWSGRQRQAEREIAAELDLHRAALRMIDDSATADEDAALAKLRREHGEATERLGKMLRAIAECELSAEMARSAAERLAAKTSDTLAAIEDGSASAAEARAVATYRARNDLAEAHLYAVNEAIEPHDDALTMARREVVDIRRRLAEIDQEIGIAIAERDTRETLRPASRRWADDTVLLPARHPEPLDGDAHFEALAEHLYRQRSAEWATPADRFVFLVRSSGDGERFAATGLRAADRALVARQPYRKRFDAVIQEAGKRQEQEIGRVLAHIAVHGEGALLGIDPGPAHRTVRRHYRLYRHHPTFSDGLPAAQAQFNLSQRAAHREQRVASAAPVSSPLVSLPLGESRGPGESASAPKAAPPLVNLMRDNVGQGPGEVPASVVQLPAGRPIADVKSTLSSATVGPVESAGTTAPAASSTQDSPDGRASPPPSAKDRAGEDLSGVLKRPDSVLSDAAAPPREVVEAQVRQAEDIHLKSSPDPTPSSVETPLMEGLPAAGVCEPGHLDPNQEAARAEAVTETIEQAPASIGTIGLDVPAASTDVVRLNDDVEPKGQEISVSLNDARTIRTTDEVATPPAPRTVEPRPQTTAMERARQQARRRSGALSADPAVPRDVEPSAAADARPERLKVGRQVVENFRQHTLYQRLSSANRSAFDTALNAPMNDLVKGRVSLKIERGKLMAAGVSEDALDRLRAFATSDCGYSLLVAAAMALPADRDLRQDWAVIDQTGVAATSSPSLGRDRGD